MPKPPLVACVSVGEPPKKKRKEAETIRFVINDFEHRKEKHGEDIVSPPVKAQGYEWKMTVSPRGNIGYDRRSISCYLIYVGNDAVVKASFTIRCKRYVTSYEKQIFEPNQIWGDQEFMPRRTVLEAFLEDDGAWFAPAFVQRY